MHCYIHSNTAKARGNIVTMPVVMTGRQFYAGLIAPGITSFHFQLARDAWGMHS